MRGKVVLVFRAVTLNRITPAYAGKRPDECGIIVYRRDHPRVCGEKTKKIP